MISSPWPAKDPSPSWFAIVPVGVQMAASLPNMAATLSCSRLMVGSSPNTSSPTSASAMALRMPGPGLVTVSLRKSMRSAMMAPHDKREREAVREDRAPAGEGDAGGADRAAVSGRAAAPRLGDSFGAVHRCDGEQDHARAVRAASDGRALRAQHAGEAGRADPPRGPVGGQGAGAARGDEGHRQGLRGEAP